MEEEGKHSNRRMEMCYKRVSEGKREEKKRKGRRLGRATAA